MLREISQLFHAFMTGLGFGFFHVEVEGISEPKSCHVSLFEIIWVQEFILLTTSVMLL